MLPAAAGVVRGRRLPFASVAVRGGGGSRVSFRGGVRGGGTERREWG